MNVFVVDCLVVSMSAVDSLERLVSKMPSYMLSGMLTSRNQLNSNHFLSAKNYILWSTFLPEKVSVHLQPLLRDPP